MELTRQEEQQLLCRAATVNAHPEDSSALEGLFASNGWQTLLQIVASSAPSSGPSNGNAGRSETPLAQFEGMGIGSSDVAGDGGSGGDAGGEKMCPHCTFINEGGRSDCEVCGLPLSG